MKNLEQFGVQELGTQEMRETEGGFPWRLVYEVVAALVGGSAPYFIDHREKMKEGWNDGWNDATRNEWV